MAKNDRPRMNLLAGIDGFDDSLAAAPTAPAVSEDKPADNPVVQAPVQTPVPQVMGEAAPSSTNPQAGGNMYVYNPRQKAVRDFRTCVNMSQELRCRARIAQDAGLFHSLNDKINVLLDEYLKQNGF